MLSDFMFYCFTVFLFVFWSSRKCFVACPLQSVSGLHSSLVVFFTNKHDDDDDVWL